MWGMSVPGRQPTWRTEKTRILKEAGIRIGKTSFMSQLGPLLSLNSISAPQTCMNLSKGLGLFVPQFPHPHNGGSSGTYLIV